MTSAIRCTLAAAALAAAAGCTSSGTGSEQPSGAECPGSGISAAAFGVAGGTAEDLARAFARTMIPDVPQSLHRLSDCAIQLRPSGTDLLFAQPSPGAVELMRASSFPDDGHPPLSVQVESGKVRANTPVTCTDCKRMTFQLIAAEGSSQPVESDIGSAMQVDTPAVWTGRGFVIRLLNFKGHVAGVIAVAIPDGDFAAG